MMTKVKAGVLFRCLIVFLIIVCGGNLAFLSGQEQGKPDGFFEEAERWMTERAISMIRQSRREMNNGVAAFPPQVGAGYEAFWLRDYSYMLEGCPEAFEKKELLDAAHLFLDSQREDGACVDCVKFDGTAIYKPGYGGMGENPVADGSPFTVNVVYCTWDYLKDRSLLEPNVLDRLERAMKAVPRNPVSGLVTIDPSKEWDRCPYGFTDSIRKQGDVLFCSLLYVQAARRLSIMLTAAGRKKESQSYEEESKAMIQSIGRELWDDDLGLFRAATVQCREHDLWGSAFAVCEGMTTPEQTRRIATYFKEHYNEIVQRGQVRGIPAGTYWEKGCEPDTYQNGAFWGTPSGWVIVTLAKVDRRLAERMTDELLTEFRTRGIFEWIYQERAELPGYLATIANPVAGLRQLCRDGGE